MNLSLNPDVQKLITQRVNSGKFATPEDVVAAAIIALDQQEQFGEFDVGELDDLLAEGERSIEQDGILAGGQALLFRRERRAAQRKSLP
jgi:Arc/MetJ-type ribon-helix-helix transcriptional regulator